jgi:hypothetical protein
MMALTWPRTHDAVYPADSPVAHLRNGLMVLQLHREVFGVPPEVAAAWAAAERRIALALEGLEQLQTGGFVREAPR